MASRLAGLIYLTAVALTLSILGTSPALAGSIAGFGGATEITQLANYGQLIASYAKQAAMVENQITAQITRVESYITQLENLYKLPQEMMNQTIAPWKSQLGFFQKLNSSVGALQSSANQVSGLYNQGATEAANLQMTGTQYLTAFQNLAQTRGGIYQQQYQQDVSALEQLSMRAQNLQTLAAQAPNISGEVQGLQLLNQQSNIVAAQTLEMTALLQRQVTEQETAQGTALQVQSDTTQQMLNQSNEATQSNAAEQSSVNSGTFNILIDSK